MADFASNANYIAPVEAPYLGEPTKVAMTEAQRANGFVPEQPVAAEHLNYELNLIPWLIATGLESTALANWSPQTSGTSEHLNKVAWNGSAFVLVGGTGTILTSPDGITWTSRTSGTTAHLNGVAWSGSLFVAVGNTGTILTSPDGITWTSRTSGTTVQLNSAAWGGSLFVTVGQTLGTVRTSPDGITWTSRSGAPGIPLRSVAWSSTLSLFLIAALGTFNNIITSPDGITWTQRATPKAVGWAVVVPTARHVIVAGEGWILISRDGITWNVADASGNLRGGAWSGQGAVLIGETGAILRSHRVPSA